MARVRFTTTFDNELLTMVREKAAAEGLEGANVIIEDALRLYFANLETEVWEKALSSGWFKKLIVRPGKVVFESIRVRKLLNYSPKYYTDEALTVKGWHKVWKMKKAG